MGTTAQKLQRIIDTKEEIRLAIITKGIDVPTTLPFQNYAACILSIPSGGADTEEINIACQKYLDYMTTGVLQTDAFYSNIESKCQILYSRCLINED